MRLRKITAVILAVVMVFTMLPFSAFAADDTEIAEIIVPVNKTYLTTRVTQPVFYDELKAVTKSGETVTLSGIKWVSDKTYSIASRGTYVFTIDPESISGYTASEQVIADASIEAELIAENIGYTNNEITVNGVPTLFNLYGEMVELEGNDGEIEYDGNMAAYDLTGCNLVYSASTSLSKTTNIYAGAASGEVVGDTEINAMFGAATNIFGGMNNGTRMTGDAHVNIGDTFTVTGDVYAGSSVGTLDGDAYITISGTAMVAGTVHAGGKRGVVTGTTYITVEDDAYVDEIDISNAANVVINVPDGFDTSVIIADTSAYTKSVKVFAAGEEVKLIKSVTSNLSGISVEGGTTEEDIPFPKTIDVVTIDGPDTANVTWIGSGYDSITAGTYRFTAVVESGYSFSRNAAAPVIEVTVGKLDSTIASFDIPVDHTYFVSSETQAVASPVFYSSLTAVDTHGRTVTVNGLKWVCDNYVATTAGDYVFKLDASGVTDVTVPAEVAEKTTITVTVINGGWRNHVGYFKSNGTTVIPVMVKNNGTSTPNGLYDLTGCNLIYQTGISVNLRIAGGVGYSTATGKGNDMTPGQTATVILDEGAEVEAAIAGSVAKAFNGTSNVTIAEASAQRVVAGNLNSGFTGDSHIYLKGNASVGTLYLGSIYDAGAKSASGASGVILGSEAEVAFSGTAHLHIDESFTGSIGAFDLATHDKIVIDVATVDMLSLIPGDILNDSSVSIWVNGVPARVITSTTVTPNELAVAYGTSLSKIVFPETVEAVMSGGATETVKVAGWTSETYDPIKAGSYEFMPVFTSDYLIFDDSGIAKLTVKVDPASSESIASFNVPVLDTYFSLAKTSSYYSYSVPELYTSLTATMSDGKTVTLDGIRWLNDNFDLNKVGDYVFSIDPASVSGYAVTDSAFENGKITAHVVDRAVSVTGNTLYFSGMSALLKGTSASYYAYDLTGFNRLPVTSGSTTTLVTAAITAKNIYGGTLSTAINNDFTIAFEGVTVAAVYGGSASAAINGDVTIEAKNTTFTGAVFLGSQVADQHGDINAHFDGCTFSGNLYLSVRLSTHYGKSTVIMDNVTSTGSVFGGPYDAAAEVSETELVLNGGSFATICAGPYNGINFFAKTIVNGAKITTLYLGGSNTSAYTYSSDLVMNSGTIGEIYGGTIKSGDLTFKNSMTFNGGTVTGNIYPTGNMNGTGRVVHLSEVKGSEIYTSKIKYNTSDGYYLSVNGVRNGNAPRTFNPNNGSAAEKTYTSIDVKSNFLGSGYTYIFCNGIPVVVDKESDGHTYLYDTNGNKLLTQPIDYMYVCGGGHQKDVASTSVTINGGYIRGLFGGGFASTVSGQAKIVMNSGVVRDVFAGAGGNDNNRMVRTGSVDITVNGGYAGKFIAAAGRVGQVGYPDKTDVTAVRVEINGGVTQHFSSGIHDYKELPYNTTYGNVEVILNSGRLREFWFGGEGGSLNHGGIDLTITGGTIETPIRVIGNNGTYGGFDGYSSITVPENYDLSLIKGRAHPRLTIKRGPGEYEYEPTSTTMAQDKAAVADLTKDSGLVIRVLELNKEGKFSPVGKDLCGDCMLITLPNGEHMLLDSGVSAVTENIMQQLKSMGIDKIEYGIVSHYHGDHVGGWDTIAKTFGIKKMYVPDITITTAHTTYDRVMSLASTGVEFVKLHRGDTFTLGGVNFTAINPQGSLTYTTSSYTEAEANNVGLVLRLDYGESSAMLTADIYEARENQLLSVYGSAPGGMLDVDLYKLPHHGHTTSSIPEFLRAVNPEYIFVTNNYEQFAGLALTKYLMEYEAGIDLSTVYSTGQYGMLKFTLDGTDVSVETEWFDMTVGDPANYAGVEEALKKVPEDLSIYTDESAERVRKAVDDVVYNYTAQYQDRVDAMAKAIEDAVKALETRLADYSDVEALLLAAPKEAEYKYYTEESLAKLLEVINGIDFNLTYKDQATVDGYVEALKAALEGLQEEFVSADYSAVDRAKASVPKDLSKYTEESAEAVRKALEAVEEGLSYKDQKKVDAFADAINKAVAALELVITEADYTKVYEALAQVPESLDCYSAVYRRRIETAIEGIVYGLTSDQQATVDGYASAILMALAMAETTATHQPGDPKHTDATCTEAAKDEVTCSVCGKLISSTTSGEPLGHDYEDTVVPPTETEQGYTEHVCSRCGDTYRDNYTDFDAADYSAVDAALAKVPQDLSKYTDETAKAVEEAVKGVVRGLPKDRQAEVDAMAKAIEEAVAALEEKINLADYSAVDAALAKVPEDLSKYTDETAKAVEEAVKAVVRGLTDDRQAEVDAMAKAIEEAVAALVEKVPANYDEVNAALEKAKNIDRSKYTEASLKALDDAVAAVEEGLTNQDQDRVDAMAKAIENALANLVEKTPANYTAVDEALAKVPSDAELEDYTTASAKALKDAVDAVVRGLYDDEQDRVDAMAKAIEDALSALKLKTDPADYTAVDKALAKVPADLSVYTDATAQKLKDAIDAVERDLTAEDQDKVDAMAEAIETAIAGLVRKSNGGGGFGGGGGGGGGVPAAQDTVKTGTTANGSFTVSDKTAKSGSTVKVTPKADKGYTVGDVTVKDVNGNKVNVTDNGDGTYSFVMPAAAPVTIDVTFVPETSAGFFIDVPQGAYYYDPVEWAVENGITNGYTETEFAPNLDCTRAQIVTFLWRASGSPAAQGTENPFIDLDQNAYYYDAVLWAVENGITNGVSENEFAPNETCTRAQIVTFLWRYHGEPEATGETFADVVPGSYYEAAVTWAVANEITNGYAENAFAPNENCTRAQSVTFLYRDLADK